MALFVDSIPSEPSDLSQYESSIFQTAAAEGIDLVAKGALAATEIGLDLQHFLLRVAAGSNIAIDQVVTNDALRRWHILRTLALVYRDAYHQQLNDRYKHKLSIYESQSASAAELLFQLGVGITYSPIHRPGKPTLSQAVGAHAANTWFTKVSWISDRGTESEASPIASIATEHGSALTVAPPAPPANAVAWNIYAGQNEEELARQNSAPLSLAEPWVLPDAGLGSGATPPKGQLPDSSLRRTTTFFRG